MRPNSVSPPRPNDICPITGKVGRAWTQTAKVLYGHNVSAEAADTFAFLRRLAFVIDFVLYLMATGFLAAILQPMFERTGVPGFVWWLTFAIFITKDGWFAGQSPGKMLVGLRVVNAETGEPIEWVQSVFRNLILLFWLPIPDTTIFLPIGIFIVFLQMEAGRRVGDGLINVKVVWLKHAHVSVFAPAQGFVASPSSRAPKSAPPPRPSAGPRPWELAPPPPSTPPAPPASSAQPSGAAYHGRPQMHRPGEVQRDAFGRPMTVPPSPPPLVGAPQNQPPRGVPLAPKVVYDAPPRSHPPQRPLSPHQNRPPVQAQAQVHAQPARRPSSLSPLAIPARPASLSPLPPRPPKPVLPPRPVMASPARPSAPLPLPVSSSRDYDYDYTDSTAGRESLRGVTETPMALSPIYDRLVTAREADANESAHQFTQRYGSMTDGTTGHVGGFGTPASIVPTAAMYAHTAGMRAYDDHNHEALDVADDFGGFRHDLYQNSLDIGRYRMSYDGHLYEAQTT